MRELFEKIKSSFRFFRVVETLTGVIVVIIFFSFVLNFIGLRALKNNTALIIQSVEAQNGLLKAQLDRYEILLSEHEASMKLIHENDKDLLARAKRIKENHEMLKQNNLLLHESIEITRGNHPFHIENRDNILYIKNKLNQCIECHHCK